MGSKFSPFSKTIQPRSSNGGENVVIIFHDCIFVFQIRDEDKIPDDIDDPQAYRFVISMYHYYHHYKNMPVQIY